MSYAIFDPTRLVERLKRRKAINDAYDRVLWLTQDMVEAVHVMCAACECYNVVLDEAAGNLLLGKAYISHKTMVMSPAFVETLYNVARDLESYREQA